MDYYKCYIINNYCIFCKTLCIVFIILFKKSSKLFDVIIIFGFLISFSIKHKKSNNFPLVQLYGLGVLHKVMGPMWDVCICTLTCAYVHT